MRGRIRDKVKRKFQNAMRDVVKGLSRSVLVYKQPIKSECTNCYFDKLTDRSTGKCKWNFEQAPIKQKEWEDAGNAIPRYKYFVRGRCPICMGKGYLETHRRTWIDCLVTWDPDAGSASNSFIMTPAGTEGSTIVQLKTEPCHYNTFKDCTRILVDNVECKLSKPPIMRGLGNQALLVVIAFTTEKPDLDTNEIIKDYT